MKYDYKIEELDLTNGFGKVLSQIEPHSTVLECGCATGYMTRYMKEKLNCDVYIVEIEKEAFDIAKQYSKDGICADLTQDEWFIKFQHMQFDYILLTDVLEHLSSPKSVLQRAAKLLKISGKVLISLPNVGHNDILMKLYDNHWDYQKLGILDDTHIHFWAYNNIAELFVDTGLAMTVIDASLMETFHTEQYSQLKREVNPSFYYMLKHRKNGEVYQFIVTAQLQKEVEEKNIELKLLLPDGADPEYVSLDEIKTYSDLEKEINEKESNIQKLEQERTVINQKNEELSNMNEESVQKINQYIGEIAAYTKEHERLEDRLTILSSQNAELLKTQEKIIEEKEQKENDIILLNQEQKKITEENEVVIEENEALKEERKRLEDQIAILSSQNAELLKTQEKIIEEKEQKENDIILLNQEKKQIIKEKEVIIDEKNNLKDECKDLAKQRGELEHELRVATSNLKHIYDSDMYQFSLKYYRIRDKLFPADSARVVFMKKIVQKLKDHFAKSKNSNSAEVEIAKNQIDKFFDYGEFTQMGIITMPHTMFIAKLIEKELERLSIESVISVGEPETYLDIPYIIVCPQFVHNFPPVYIAFQMEQTVSSRWFNQEYFVRMQNSCAIFDYSLNNVEFFHKREYRDITSRVYYLPIDYYSDFEEPQKDLEKEYDVIFYGDANSCARRREILDELSKHFSVKICSEVFGQDVYKEIRKAKVMINIHYYEGALLETTRLYETLSLNTCVIVSEKSDIAYESDRLENIVDFVDIGNVEQMKERISYWVTHDTERNKKVKENKKILTERPNAFSFFFYRFLLAYDRISFDKFYYLAGDYVQLHTNRICLSLPESVQRRKSFDLDNKYGFECFPGLRHLKGWVGCGLSYKMIFTKALEAGMDEIMICEDDVIFPDNFSMQLDKIMTYLHRKKTWSLFSGIMADVGKVKVLGCDKQDNLSILHIDHMISMVFNIYNKSMFNYFCNWNERNRDVYKNAIDRYLENKELSVFVQVPFLVGHKEELNSSVWGFSNIEYSQLIQNSEKKLLDLVEQSSKNTDTKE